MNQCVLLKVSTFMSDSSSSSLTSYSPNWPTLLTGPYVKDSYAVWFIISADPVKPRTLYLNCIPPRYGDFDFEDGVLLFFLRPEGVLPRRDGEVVCFRGDLLGGELLGEDLLDYSPFASSFDSSMSSKFPITFGPWSRTASSASSASFRYLFLPTCYPAFNASRASFWTSSWSFSILASNFYLRMRSFLRARSIRWLFVKPTNADLFYFFLLMGSGRPSKYWFKFGTMPSSRSSSSSIVLGFM